MQLEDLLDTDLLARMLDEKYVRRQAHPSLPYHILNYTEKAQFERVWNDVTRQCRGLIYSEDGEVLARPFDKFFNYGEQDVFHSYYTSRVTVTDKLDGSLGILYPNYYVEGTPGWAVATRGSFASPQAIHANAKLQEYLDMGWEPHEGVTYLWEIIYPENRIVCNYHGMDDLVLLGVRHVNGGWTAGPDSGLVENWPGPRAKVFNCATFQQAIEMQPRPGAEGIVVHFHDLDMRLKIKQTDYIELHRIVTGLNERAVWRMLREGKNYGAITRNLPEEFWDWVNGTIADLMREFGTWDLKVMRAFDRIMIELDSYEAEGVAWTRKDFALKALKEKDNLAPMLFNKLDGKDYSQAIWDRIQPPPSQGPWSQSEDTA